MNEGELLLYVTEDGSARFFLRAEDGSVWLTQLDLAELFQTSIPNISTHLKNVLGEGELQPEATIKENLIVRTEGKRQVSRPVKLYNLDMILAVGYRVKSARGTQFRQWATTHLREYLIKGFVMDDERLKDPTGWDYFDELLQRIRDIRSSEKVFWRKMLEIYATSIDYDPHADTSQQFFATVQNKMHWAAHGHTAAEIVAGRADAARPNMGLTNWPGARPHKVDVGVAKNYLSPKELDALNRIVNFYLEFAELQALSRKAMTMGAWIGKLDDFLRLSERDILTHAGRVSNDAALKKAHLEYEKFREAQLQAPSPVEQHFAEAVSHGKRLEKGQKAKRGRRAS